MLIRFSAALPYISSCCKYNSLWPASFQSLDDLSLHAELQVLPGQFLLQLAAQKQAETWAPSAAQHHDHADHGNLRQLAVAAYMQASAAVVYPAH